MATTEDRLAALEKFASQLVDALNLKGIVDAPKAKKEKPAKGDADTDATGERG